MINENSFQQQLEKRRLKIMKKQESNSSSPIQVPFQIELQISKADQKQLAQLSYLQNIKLDFSSETANNNMILNFILSNQKNQEIMLVSGYQGTGKSLLRRKIEKYLWQYYESAAERKPQIIPIYVSRYISKNFLEITFESKKYCFNQQQIESLNQEVIKLNQQLTLLVDLKQTTNLDEENIMSMCSELKAQWKNFQIIYFCHLENVCTLNLRQFKLITYHIQVLEFSDEQINNYFVQQKNKNTQEVLQHFYKATSKQQVVAKCKVLQQNIIAKQENQIRPDQYHILYEDSEQLLLNLLLQENASNINSVQDNAYKIISQISNIYQYETLIKEYLLIDVARLPLLLKAICEISKNIFLKSKPTILQFYQALIFHLIKQQNMNENEKNLDEVFFMLKNITLQVFCMPPQDLLNQSQQKQFIQSCFETIKEHINQCNFILNAYVQKPIVSTFIGQYYNDCLQALNDIDINYFDLKNNQFFLKIRDEEQFGKYNLALKIFSDVPKFIDYQIFNNQSLKEKLIMLIKASSVIDDFEQVAGNAFILIKELTTVFRKVDFQQIRIKNSNLNDLTFHQCNFENSQMDNVEITGAHYFSCNMMSTNWKNMIKLEPISFGDFTKNSDQIKFLSFSNEFAYVATIYREFQIVVWKCKQGKVLKSWIKKDMFNTIAYSDVGHNLFYGNDTQFCLSNIQTGKMLKKFKIQLQNQQDEEPNYFLYFWDISTFHPIGQIERNVDGTIKSRLFVSNERNVYQNTIAYSPLCQFILIGSFQTDECKFMMRSKDQIVKIKWINNFYAFQESVPNIQILIFSQFVILFLEEDDSKQRKRFLLENIQKLNRLQTFLTSSKDGLKWAIRENNGKILIYDLNEISKSSKEMKQKSSCSQFESDGQIIASKNMEGTYIEFWNIKTGTKNKNKIFDKNINISSIALSPNGQILAGTVKEQIFLWNTENTECFQKLNGHTGLVNCVVFHDSGNLLISGGCQELIIFWSLKSMTQVKAIKIFGYVATITLQPNGQYLLLKNRVNQYEIWNQITLQKQQIKFPQNVTALAFFTNHNIIVLALSLHILNFIDLVKGNIKFTLKDDKYQCQITKLAVSNNNKKITTLNQQGVFCIYTQEAKRNWFKQYEIINDQLQQQDIYQISFLQNSQTLVIGKTDSTFLFIDSKYKKLIDSENSKDLISNTIAFSQDGDKIACAIQENVILYQAQSLKKLFQLTGHSQQINSISFSPNDKFIATASKDSTIIIWHIDSGQKFNVLYHHKDSVIIVQFSQSKFLASVSSDEVIAIWDIEQQNLLWQVKDSGQKINTIVFSYDEAILISGGQNSVIILWDVQKGVKISTLEEKIKSIFFIFSPNSNILASIEQDKNINLMSFKQAQLNRLWRLETNCSTQIMFSSTGKFFAFGTDIGEIQVWDVEKKILIQNFLGHEGRIISISFAEKGEKIYSLSADETIRLWDLRSQCLLTVKNFKPSFTQIISNTLENFYESMSVQKLQIKTFAGKQNLESTQ